MSDHLTLTQGMKKWGRIWRLILPISLAFASLFAFMGISRSAAQAQDPAFFTNCANNTGNNATVLIPGTAPKMHTTGYFTPVAGDEFAVFRPVGGTCATLAQSVCAGVIVWQGAGSFDAMTVWGDNPQAPGTDGMLAGEVMCWRVWDASENDVYTATVEYDPTPPLDPTGTYATDGLYALVDLSPTALELTSFQAGSSPVWVRMEALFAGGLVLTGAALALFRRRRRPSNI